MAMSLLCVGEGEWCNDFTPYVQTSFQTALSVYKQNDKYRKKNTELVKEVCSFDFEKKMTYSY